MIDSPPPFAYFSGRFPEAGSRTMALRLDRLEIEIAGLDGPRAQALLERYVPYSLPAAGTPDALRVRLGLADHGFFIEPRGGTEQVRVHTACDGERVRYLSHRVAGWFDTRGGRGEIVLSRGDGKPVDKSFEPDWRSFENYLRAAVAWQAISRGGALVHAASAVWKKRGYLFYGESGAGKSTLSACNRRARVVSDDLSLLTPGSDGGLDRVGTPFRGTYEGGAPVIGRYPLAAGFRLIKAPRAEVREVPRLRAIAEVVGNLPFVADCFASRPDLLAGIQQVLSGVPLAHLHFCKDDSYWDAIESAGH